MGIDIKGGLAVLAVVGLAACLFLLFYVPLPSGARDIILVVIGTFVSTVKDIYGFFFGSSYGSERKTEIMSRGNVVSGESGFSQVRVLFLLLALAAVFLMAAGCATVETPQSRAAKSLLVARQGLISSATTADDLCSRGVLKQKDCDRAKELYRQGQAASIAAFDGFLLYLQTGLVSDEAGLEALRSRISNINTDLDVLNRAFQGGGTN